MKKMSLGLAGMVLAALLGLAGCSQQTTDEQLIIARELSEKGDYDAAIIALKNAVQQNPQQGLLRFELGKAYLAINDYIAAEKELSRAFDLGYDAAAVLPLLSKAYQHTQADVALSKVDIETAGLTDVDKLIVGYRKALSMIELEQYQDAVALSEELQALDVASVYKDLVQIIPLLAQSAYPDALAIAERAEQRAPLNSDVLLLLARLYSLNEQPENAISIFKDYLRVEPNDLQVKFVLAGLMIQQRQADAAEIYIDELLNINDQSPYLNQLKGIARAVDQDYAGALMYTEKAIISGNKDPTLRMVAGFSAFNQGEYDKAVEHLSLIANLLPNDHAGLRLLALSQLNSQTRDQVKFIIDRMDELGPTDAPIVTGAALAMLRADDEQATRAIVERASESEVAVSAVDFARLGVIQLSLDDIDGLVSLQQAVAKAEQPLNYQRLLALAYLRAGKYQEARSLAETWRQSEETRFDGLVLSANVELENDNLASAEPLIKEALALKPNAVPAQLANMAWLKKRGQTVEAVTAAEQVLKSAPDNAEAWEMLLEPSQPSEARNTRLSQLIAYLNDSETPNTRLSVFAARSALQLRQPQNALALMESVNLTEDTPQSVWQMKGNALIHANRVDDAEAHFRTWSERFPNQENAALGLISVLNVQRKFAEALNEAERFLAVENNMEVRMLQSYVLTMLGRADEAKAVYQTLDQALLETPFMRGVNARIALLESRPADGLEDALAAYSTDDHFDNLFLAVQTYASLRQQDKSLELLESHYANKPGDMRVLMLMAEYQFVLKPEKAKQSYRKAIELQPANFIAWNNLAYLTMNSDDLDSARDYAEQAYEIAPTNVGVADTYAQILLRLEQIEDAIEIYDAAISDDTAAEHIRLNYVEALLIKGDKELAQRKLERMRFSLPASFIKLEQLTKEYALSDS